MKKLFLLLLTFIAIKAIAQNTTSQTATNQRLRIALQGGFSQLLAKISDAVSPENRNYVSELKSGYHYGTDVTYFIKNTLGLGAKFSQFKTSNTGGTTIVNGVPVSLAEDITHTFIAPSFSSKYTSLNNKHNFIFSVGLGYLGYRDDAIVSGVPVKATASTFGSAIDAGYDLNLTKNFAIGAQLAFVGGAINKITYNGPGGTYTTELGKDQKESLVRLDISFGARFNF